MSLTPGVGKTPSPFLAAWAHRRPSGGTGGEILGPGIPRYRPPRLPILIRAPQSPKGRGDTPPQFPQSSLLSNRMAGAPAGDGPTAGNPTHTTPLLLWLDRSRPAEEDPARELDRVLGVHPAAAPAARVAWLVGLAEAALQFSRSFMGFQVTLPT